MHSKAWGGHQGYLSMTLWLILKHGSSSFIAIQKYFSSNNLFLSRRSFSFCDCERWLHRRATSDSCSCVKVNSLHWAIIFKGTLACTGEWPIHDTARVTSLHSQVRSLFSLPICFVWHNSLFFLASIFFFLKIMVKKKEKGAAFSPMAGRLG